MRLLAIIILFYTSNLFSQVTPCFTISDTSGCVGDIFNVKNCSGLAPYYYFDYTNSPLILTTDSSHTYTEPGIYQVTQSVFDGPTPIYHKPITITIKGKPIPKFEIALCNNYGVQIIIPDSGYTNYEVDWGIGPIEVYNANDKAKHNYPDDALRMITITGKHQPENCGASFSTSTNPIPSIKKANIDTLKVITDDMIVLIIDGQKNVIYDIEFNGNTHQINAPSNTFTDTLFGLNTTSTTYCVEVKSFNPCDNIVEETSDKVCSIVLSATATPGFNTVSWKSYNGDNFDDFNLYENINSIYQSSTNNFIDSNVLCDVVYKYQLTTTSKNKNTSISISNIATVVGESEKNPAPVTDIFSTYNSENELIVSWKNTSKIAPHHFNVNSLTSNDTFLIINSFEKDCYVITYTDNCNNTSQLSEETCPIVLEAEQNSVFEIGLDWNNYKTFIKGLLDFDLEIYDNTKTLISNLNMDLNNDFIFDVTNESNQIYYFRIKGNSIDSLNTFSNEVELILDNKIRIPNAFSPNGDGQNDFFIPKVRFIESFKMNIYNKWGASLFTSNDINNGWTGDNFPSGVYTYVIEVKDYLGTTTNKKGTVTLIR